MAPLAAVAEISACLALGEPLDEIVPAVLALTRGRLGALEVAIWLSTPRGLERSWADGPQGVSGAEVAEVLRLQGAGAGGTMFVPMAAQGTVVGALVIRSADTLHADDRLFLTTVANLLTPVVTHTEYLRRLEREVELRARETEEQRRFTQRIIDSLPVGLYVIDREYRIQAWNRKRETGMQGVSREEAIGRTIFEILHRQPAELLRQEFDDVFATGRIQQFEVVSDTTGDERTYRISKIPMRVGDMAVTHVITIGEDVTDWREAQERFAQAEKLAAIGTLAAGVMHEINNPLATIAACAESLGLRFVELQAAGGVLPAESGEYLRIVEDEVHRCKRIVDGLLDFSRPKPTTKSRVDLNAVIEQTLFLLKHHARFKKLKVQLELEQNLGNDIVGNPEQLVQVFMALLINATDAMAEQGTVTVRTRRGRDRGEAIIAEVQDEGHGIRRSELGKIFEPFFTTKAPGRGTGLGLSICYGIIADHGGRIEVDSTPRLGSTFRIILPVQHTP